MSFSRFPRSTFISSITFAGRRRVFERRENPLRARPEKAAGLLSARYQPMRGRCNCIPTVSTVPDVRANGRRKTVEPRRRRRCCARPYARTRSQMRFVFDVYTCRPRSRARTCTRTIALLSPYHTGNTIQRSRCIHKRRCRRRARRRSAYLVGLSLSAVFARAIADTTHTHTHACTHTYACTNASHASSPSSRVASRVEILPAACSWNSFVFTVIRRVRVIKRD